jgi:multiple sugar transport system substrate-binding protein
MGREGEVVQELLADFERENPRIDVVVQQVPWSAAHEKLLTAFVGRSTPDLAQMGNTWVSEFAALDALEPLDGWAARDLPAEGFFDGIWDTNVIDEVLLGIPWYVDTRVLFYRRDLLEQAGYEAMPVTWEDWRHALAGIKRHVGPDRFAVLLPVNEWTQIAIMGLQAGSPLLTDGATRGAFTEPAFRRAMEFYVDLFREGLAPPVSNNEVSNVYQEFARGYFAMYITGPWNLGEFRRRLPADMEGAWAIAPLPGPTGAGDGVSLAGGSSLTIFRASDHKAEAWEVIRFLSSPRQQARFFELMGNLPARREAWSDPRVTRDSMVGAFAEQLDRVVPTPKIPEWELIATRLREHTERAVRGSAPVDSVLAQLDRDVWRILEKRRWLLGNRSQASMSPEGLP